MGDFHYTMLDRDDGTKVGAHSITINGMNTWDIWHMAPKSRPFVSPPQVKTEYVDVPGADGALDYTEVLTAWGSGSRSGTATGKKSLTTSCFRSITP